MTTDPHGIITDVNQQAETLTGCTRDELIGAPFKSHFTDPDRAEAGIKLVLNEMKVTDYELTARARDGKETVVSYNATTFYDRDRKLQGVFSAARDVTERKKTEEALLSLKNDLENRVHQRTAELEVANKELEAFAYSVSHDLRAPLRAIDGFSRKVVAGYGDRLDDEGRRQLQVVRDNAQRMGKLIDDLLAFSRMGRREMALQPLDMEPMVRSVADELRTAEPQRTIEFAIPALPRAWGDAAMLRQVWVNLLSNAVKFSRQRKVAHIEVGGSMEGREVLYWVKDDGEPRDFIYLSVNASFEQQIGLGNVVGKRVTEVLPGIRESDPQLFEILGRVSLTGKPERFETYVEALRMWLWISVYSSKQEHFVAIFDVITERKRAEQTLRESEQRFRGFIENASDIIFELSPEGNFTYVSPNWLGHMGEPAADAIGKSFVSYIHPGDVDMCRKLLGVAVATEEPVGVEYRALHRSGAVRWQSTKGVAVRNVNGNLTGYQGIARDITERKAAEEHLRKLALAVEQSPESIVITDVDARIEYVNEAFFKVTGYSREEVIGQNPRILQSDKTPPEIYAALWCVFHAKLDTDSTRIWTVIPRQTGQ